ncbi:hypothetical protein ASE93_11945 [Serratia sp. Leaf50]|nr:hypothetical protein ASE93_11945 [Serratia sp. Leaf50]
MTNITETPKWEQSIKQIQRSEKVVGGRGGVANIQAEQLAARTQYLKSQMDSLADSREFTFYITTADPDGTIAGLAGTTQGQLFRVTQGMAADEAFIYYVNTNGTALPVSSFISAMGIKRLLPQYNQQPSMVAGFIDEDGYIPLWFTNGDLDVRGVGQSTINFIFENSELFAEVKDYAKKYNFSGVMVALAVDDNGNVATWLNDGDFDARGVGPNIIKILSDALPFQKAGIEVPAPVSSGKSLWRWRAKKAKLDTGAAAYAKAAFTGDSWTEYPGIAQALADIIFGNYAKAGDGMLQFGVDKGGPSGSKGQQMNGITLEGDGWAAYDASVIPYTDPLYGCGADGMAIYTSGPNATLRYGNLTTTAITINYWDLAGKFRYRTDDNAWTTVTGGGTNAAKSVVISGLSLGVHSIEIDTTPNDSGGVVSLLSLVSKGTGNGVEVTKLGNGGIRADGYKKVLPYIPFTAQQLDVDLLFMIIGTNDARASISFELFETSLDEWVNAWQKASPDTGIVLIVPSQGNATYNIPLTSIRDATLRIAKKYNVEWFDFSAFMPDSWGKSNSLGMYYDSLHLNAVGCSHLATLLHKNFI